MYTMKALFIGRFQPFHKGHLKIIQDSSEKYDEVIIGIGSSQHGHALENPFTSDERKLMIKKSLEKVGITNYRIVLIPDIHNPPKWADHVLSIVSDFDVVLSNSPLTRQLFLEKKYAVEETPLYNKKEYSGKEIRRRIIKDEPWKDSVPLEVFNIINENDGIRRLKKLSEK